MMRLRTDGVTWREIDGETVILDLSTSTYLKTNESGSTLMRLLADDRSLTELIDGLVENFDITSEQARADVETFLGMLRERDLLDVSEA